MSGNSRSLPSNIWATLALGYSPIGSIPYVASDGASIETDIQHFFYTASGQEDYASAKLPYQLTAWGSFRVGFKDISISQAGSVVLTCNAPMGKLQIPALVNAVAVYCTYCTPLSIVLVAMETIDATMKYILAAANNGIFYISGNANATAPVYVKYFIINPMSTGP